MNNEQGLQLQRLTGHVVYNAEDHRQDTGEPCVAFVLTGGYRRSLLSRRLKELPLFVPHEGRQECEPHHEQINSSRYDGGGK